MGVSRGDGCRGRDKPAARSDMIYESETREERAATDFYRLREAAVVFFSLRTRYVLIHAHLSFFFTSRAQDFKCVKERIKVLENQALL